MKGQGALEYLLIAGAVILIVTLVILLLSGFFSGAQVSEDVATDIASCNLNNTELVGYTQAYTGTENEPISIKYRGRALPKQGTTASSYGDVVCQLNGYDLYFYRSEEGELAYYLQRSDGDYFEYAEEAGVGEGAQPTLKDMEFYAGDDSACGDTDGTDDVYRTKPGPPIQRIKLVFDLTNVDTEGKSIYLNGVYTAYVKTTPATLKVLEDDQSTQVDSFSVTQGNTYNDIDVSSLKDEIVDDTLTFYLEGTEELKICGKGSDEEPSLTVS